jgi:acyl-coenzyme A synthetase/AMP-(fatty) acid ligase
MMTFGEMIFWHASRNPDKPAIVGPGRVITYGGLRDAIGTCAWRVQALGWKPGGTVAILMKDRVGYIILAAALARLGFVTMSARGWGDVMDSGLELAGVVSSHPAPPENRAPFAQMDATWVEPGSEKRLPPPLTVLDAGAVHHVALTSGSTGRPKPVGFDAHAIREIQISLGLIGDAIAWDRVCSLPSLESYFGYGVATMALFLGKTLVFADSVVDSMHLVALFGVEWIVASNIQLERILHMQANMPIACPSLRMVYFGGSLVTKALLRGARAYLPAQIVCGYGSTESGVIAVGPAERLPARDGATGYVAPWVTMEIVDGEGRALPPGSEGVIRFRTPGQGRIFNPATGIFDALDPVSGWVYSGDLGLLQPDGVLVITGRADEVINAGGVKFAPEILEQSLLAHPEVAEAAVVSLPDPFGVEEAWVAVVPRNPGVDKDALRRQCLERVRQVNFRELVFVDAIPRTDLGKPARAEVRKILLSMKNSGGATQA